MFGRGPATFSAALASEGKINTSASAQRRIRAVFNRRCIRNRLPKTSASPRAISRADDWSFQLIGARFTGIKMNGLRPGIRLLMNKFCAFVLAILSLAPCSHAWNAEGHMVVAQIAYNHLTASVRSNCDALIAVPLTYANTGTSNFITAACWADDFKGNLNTANWHYIDIPFSLDGTPTNGVGTTSFDVVRAINQCVQALGSTATSQSNQAVYLRYLLHFVGDIHQPLHASTAVFAGATAGDGGGNGFSISGTWNNLHSLWDAGGGYVAASMGRPLNASNKTILSNKVAQIEVDYPYPGNSSVIEDPMNWAIEGYNLAQTVAYVGINQGETPTSSYTSAVQDTVESRLALAGHRLADLLNNLFTPFPTSLKLNAASSGSVSFSWNAIPGRTYKVQRKQTLADVWATIAVVTPKSGTATYSEAMGTTTRFYQVTQ